MASYAELLPGFVPSFWLKWLVVCVGIALLHQLAWCVYCLYFHPLARFPGPKLAAVSDVWLARTWLSGRYAKIIQAAHEKYGDVVRVAPNELTFATVQAHRDIYSTPSKTGKTKKPFLKDGQFYNNGDVKTLFYELDPAEHARQRKLLAPGFSAAAMRFHEPVIHRYTDLFVDQLENLDRESHGAGFNVTEAFMWLGFDIMGELTFSESFGTVKNMKPHFWISLLRDSAHAAILPSLISRLPWLWPLLPFMVSFSSLRNLRKHYAYTLATVRRRVQRDADANPCALPDASKDAVKKTTTETEKTEGKDKPKQPTDLFAPIIAHGNMSEKQLVSLAQAIIIAGADTVSHVLTGAFYFLTTHPSSLSALQHEIRNSFSSMDPKVMSGGALAGCRWLNAVLEETMRCFPPIAFGLPRVSPGEVVDGRFVADGSVVSAPHWAVLHRGDSWEAPFAFRPERWLGGGEGEGVGGGTDGQPRGLPFSSGPRACLGIAQAYLELRIALAKLVWTYDISLVGDHGDWLGRAQMHMLWKEAPLMVHFQRREGEDGVEDEVIERGVSLRNVWVLS
ncbi:Uu.00g084290.m01.CDS01 [Anthostomella pinea]|uniref:Uu.00g084290.m01.CDS01 n=1 Tax=Anthostomella pinea TaxID=933095 RepID=A0AAI8VLT6_9PEZI|nr:Uu.00g084290.m01.CDS01 [Anthostomella pinea]